MGQLETEERPAPSISRYRREINAKKKIDKGRERKKSTVMECVVGRQWESSYGAFVKYYISLTES